MNTDRLAATRAVLDAHGQEHLLTFYDQLDPRRQESLLDQIEAIDFDELDRLIERYVVRKPTFDLPANLEPAPYYPIDPPEHLRRKYTDARAVGEQLVRGGKVAAMVVAGGSGTRLGWAGPKGTFPGTPISGKCLFQVFAESIVRSQRKYGSTIPWLVMTSPANDAQTRAFFAEHEHFGLSAEQMIFFVQGTMPGISDAGRILLADPANLVLNADGHGGSLKALYRSGALQALADRGIEHISYFQVDNPTVKVIDPLFIGLHEVDQSQMSSKMVAKNYGMEKLGNFCLVDGKMTIVEYSDLPEHLANQTLDDGQLRFKAGSPAIHAIAVEFVRQLNAGGELQLPYHRAEKKIPHLDPATGRMVEPTEPNGVKLEQFIFDALPMARHAIVLQTTRQEEMAFIKNAQGESSPATSRQFQSDRAARWLASVGVDVPGPDADGHYNCTIELSPLTAVEPDDLNHADLPAKIDAGAEVVL
jgi:UDP-N-acetylglucosamine/UDP-N-acetylgalactosamine diphosphorylase